MCITQVGKTRKTKGKITGWKVFGIMYSDRHGYATSIHPTALFTHDYQLMMYNHPNWFYHANRKKTFCDGQEYQTGICVFKRLKDAKQFSTWISRSFTIGKVEIPKNTEVTEALESIKYHCLICESIYIPQVDLNDVRLKVLEMEE